MKQPIVRYDGAIMSVQLERREEADRRRHPRGGRRPSDVPGLTPLVLVVETDAHARELCEAILAKLQFAVAPADSLVQSLALMASLQPDVIVARTPDVDRLLAAGIQHGIPVPVVSVAVGPPNPATLIEDIRLALRAAAAREARI